MIFQRFADIQFAGSSIGGMFICSYFVNNEDVYY